VAFFAKSAPAIRDARQLSLVIPARREIILVHRHPMDKKLSLDDARAVDLYLGQRAAGSTPAPSDGNGHSSPDGGSGAPAFSTSSKALGKKLLAVERLLGLLDSWAAPDPSGDLVKRTLRHVDNSPSGPHPSTPGDLSTRPIA
jgi:hypothetical protein